MQREYSHFKIKQQHIKAPDIQYCEMTQTHHLRTEKFVHKSSNLKY